MFLSLCSQLSMTVAYIWGWMFLQLGRERLVAFILRQPPAPFFLMDTGNFFSHFLKNLCHIRRNLYKGVNGFLWWQVWEMAGLGSFALFIYQNPFLPSFGKSSFLSMGAKSSLTPHSSAGAATQSTPPLGYRAGCIIRDWLYAYTLLVVLPTLIDLGMDTWPEPGQLGSFPTILFTDGKKKGGGAFFPLQSLAEVMELSLVMLSPPTSLQKQLIYNRKE